MGLLVGIAAAVAAVGLLGGGLVALGRRGSNVETAERLQAQGLTVEQAETLKKGDKAIRSAQNLAYRLRDAQLREAAKETVDKAHKVLTAMKKQPAEIRRATQYFSYYLPTMSVVLQQYLSLEEEGKQTPEMLQKTKDYLADMSHAFDLQFDNMFKDEQLNLEVEVEAMQMALKRDGLG